VRQLDFVTGNARWLAPAGHGGRPGHRTAADYGRGVNLATGSGRYWCWPRKDHEKAGEWTALQQSEGEEFDQGENS